MPHSQHPLVPLSPPQILDILKNNEKLFAEHFQIRCDLAMDKLTKSGLSLITNEDALELAAALLLSVNDEHAVAPAKIIYRNFLMNSYLEDLIQEGAIVVPSKQDKPRAGEGSVQTDS